MDVTMYLLVTYRTIHVWSFLFLDWIYIIINFHWDDWMKSMSSLQYVSGSGLVTVCFGRNKMSRKSKMQMMLFLILAFLTTEYWNLEKTTYSLVIYIYNLGTLSVCLCVQDNLSQLKSHLHEIWAQYVFWANLKHCEVGFLNFDFKGGCHIPLVLKFRFRLSGIISAIWSNRVIKI